MDSSRFHGFQPCPRLCDDFYVVLMFEDHRKAAANQRLVVDYGNATILADLMQSGKVTPVIDRRYSLSEVPEAIRYSETGRARGKILINIE